HCSRWCRCFVEVQQNVPPLAPRTWFTCQGIDGGRAPHPQILCPGRRCACSEVQARTSFRGLLGDRMYVPLPQDHVALTVQLDLTLLLGVEEHTITGLDVAGACTGPCHLTPDQLGRQLHCVRDDQAGAAAPLALVGDRTHQQAVVKHLDFKLCFGHHSRIFGSHRYELNDQRHVNPGPSTPCHPVQWNHRRAGEPPGTPGAMAQLVARLHGMEEVWGSNPHSSTQTVRTKKPRPPTGLLRVHRGKCLPWFQSPTTYRYSPGPPPATRGHGTVGVLITHVNDVPPPSAG